MNNFHIFCSGQPVTHPLDCPVGRYCTGGTSVPELCPAGTFGPDTNAVGLENCTSCTPGMYCGIDGLDAPSGNCSAGFYCTGGAILSSPTDHLVRLSFYFCLHSSVHNSASHSFPQFCWKQNSAYDCMRLEMLHCRETFIFHHLNMT